MRSPEERQAFRRRIYAYEQTEAWKRRSRRFRAKHGRCMVPGCPAVRVDVHHVTYDRAFTGREPDRDLRSVCRPHHEDIHDLARGGMPLALATAEVLGRDTAPTGRGGCLVGLVFLGAVVFAYGRSRGWW